MKQFEAAIAATILTLIACIIITLSSVWLSSLGAGEFNQDFGSFDFGFGGLSTFKRDSYAVRDIFDALFFNHVDEKSSIEEKVEQARLILGGLDDERLESKKINKIFRDLSLEVHPDKDSKLL